MARGENDKVPKAIQAALAGDADISLYGDVGKEMLDKFLDQLSDARSRDGDVVLEITTPGGDAELCRRFVMEIERAAKDLKGDFLFLGKSVVYSAGISIMSAFPRRNRYLTRDTMLLIHGRQLKKTVELSGPIRTSLPCVEALASQIKIGLKLEKEGFERLIEGSKLTLDEVIGKGSENWYLTAAEALDLGLVEALV